MNPLKKIYPPKLLTGYLLFFIQIALFAQTPQPWETDFFENGESLASIHKKYNTYFDQKEGGFKILPKSDNIQIVPDNDFVKFRRWEWDMQYMLKEDGTYPTGGELIDIYTKHIRSVAGKTRNKSNSAVWENLTRTSNSGGYWGMGQTNHVEFNPDNSSEFWVAGKQGGIWHTTDNGSTYDCITDQLPFQDAGAFVVDRTNTLNIMVCVGRFFGGGMGIYRTTDGGITWQPAGLAANLSENLQFKDLEQHPAEASTYLVATTRGVYKTTDNGNNWQLVLQGHTSALAFKTDNPNMVYAMHREGLFVSSNSGNSFSLLSGDPFSGSNNFDYRITVTKAQPNKIIIYKRNQSIHATDDGGQNWYVIPAPAGGEDESIAISHENPNILYSGSFNPFKSTDNGASWEQIGHWYGGEGLPAVHADHRRFVMNPYTNELNACHDGGLSIYNEANEQWREVSNGILIPQYYSVASSEQNPEIIAVGSQDNGGSARNEDGSWRNTNGGDASTQLIDPTDQDLRYSHYNPQPEIIITRDGWRSTESVVPESGLTSAWVIPMVLDPNDNATLIAGYHALYKSSNSGRDWSKISPDFTTKGDYWTALQSLAVAPSNSDYIYTARSREFYYSHDGGQNWQNTSINIDITDIAVNPENPLELFISCGQYNANRKVLKSTDGGATWSAMTTEGLPNVPVSSIVYQRESSEILYVATLLGVYYKNGQDSNWERYGNELPYVDTRDIHINYTSKKLIAATYGRGVYQIDIEDNTLSVGDLDEVINTIRSYPNPVGNEITEFSISFDNNTSASDATVTLVNALGQVVYQSKENLTANVNTISVQTNDLKSGLYIVVLAIANAEYKQKIMITN